MFGVKPLTEEEKIVKALVLEMVSESVEKGVAPSSRKKSVILPPKGRKKHFSIFDEISPKNISNDISQSSVGCTRTSNPKEIFSTCTCTTCTVHV